MMFSSNDRKVYTCEARVLKFEPENNVVSNTTQNHLSYRANSDVRSLKIMSQRLEAFPKQIEKFFDNLEALYLANNFLTQIKSVDLEPFPQLTHLGLSNNQLVSLDSDLFRFTTKLEFINFDNNKILHVGMEIFDHLDNLSSVYLRNNVCINKTSSGIPHLRLDLARNCPPTLNMLRASIFSEKELANIVGNIVSQKLNALTERIEKVLSALEKSANEQN